MTIRVLMVAVAAMGIGLGEASAQAGNYPARTVTFIAPVAPGAGTDFLARMIGQRLAAKWGKTVVIENRPGAGTVIGATAVAHAAPDGHTLLMMTSTTLVNATLHKKLPFNPLQDLAPVAVVAEVPFVLVVNPSLPVKDVKELIEYARSRPGGLSYGSAGPGTAHHLGAEIFQKMTGVKMVHVPYGGSAPALRDVVSGHIPLMFVDITPALPLIKDGKIRALGVTNPERASIAPDIPTIAEAGVPGYASVSWQAVMATGGTPDDILIKLNRDVGEVLASSESRQRIIDIGMTPKPLASVDTLRNYMRAELDNFAKVITDAGLAGSQ